LQDYAVILIAMEFILFFVVSLGIIGSLHAFVMRSVENFDGYGSQNQRQEWREFERLKNGARY
jgi:hypothetical protein